MAATAVAVAAAVFSAIVEWLARTGSGIDGCGATVGAGDEETGVFADE